MKRKNIEIKNYNDTYEELFKKTQDLAVLINEIENLIPNHPEVMMRLSQVFFASGEFSLCLGQLFHKGEI